MTAPVKTLKQLSQIRALCLLATTVLRRTTQTRPKVKRVQGDRTKKTLVLVSLVVPIFGLPPSSSSWLCVRRLEFTCCIRIVQIVRMMIRKVTVGRGLVDAQKAKLLLARAGKARKDQEGRGDARSY